MAPTYVLIAPSKIRPNSNFSVSLEITDHCEPENFEVEISGTSHDGTHNHILKSTLVEPLETAVLNFEIDNWSNGNYKLTVKSKNFLNDNISLGYESKKHSIFVQSDKAIYKPGQTVKFRSIIVDSNLLPIFSGCVDILVKDPRGNLIKQWKQLHPQLGIISEQLQLSDQPPLGDWSIIVNVQGQTYTKKFTVSEYVLPTFSVDVHVPPSATYSQSDVVVSVKSAYTYGKPVKGECTLTGSILGIGPNFQTKQNFDGSLNIPLNIVRDFNLKPDSPNREIKFEASVIESLTSRNASSFAMMKLTNMRYDQVMIELIKMSKYFKPGLKNMVYLKIAYLGNMPVEDDGPAVCLNYYPDNKMGLSQTFESIPVKGLVCAELCEPKTKLNPTVSHSISLKAKYRGEMHDLGSIKFAESPSNSFIQIVHKNDKSFLENLFESKLVQVGEHAIFQVTSTEPLNQVRYKVMSKGDIVLAGTERINEPELNTVDITIQITHKMAPKAHLLVYYVRDANREIVADAITFQVEPIFSTPVKISSNVDQTEPGRQVDITVQTQPSAYVGLLGVDQSVLLLKSQNDITQNDVRKELNSYDSDQLRNTNSIAAKRIFSNAGVVIFTNGLLYKGHVEPDIMGYPSELFNEIKSCFGISLSAASSHRCKVSLYDKRTVSMSLSPSEKLYAKPAKSIKLRQKFPETWIWSNLFAGEDGVAKYSDQIPDTITSWFISAFAIDSLTGLGVAEDKLKINVFKPFFIQLSLPYSIIRGESAVLQVLVFNYQNKFVETEVIMESNDNEFIFDEEQIEELGESYKKTTKNRRCASISPLDCSSVSFKITPTKLGYINIKVRATCDNAGDAILKTLLVKPEGQTQYTNKAWFIKLESGSNDVAKKNVSIEIPQNAVTDSTKIYVSGISDIFGSAINHMDDLLRIPYGCGEQNMINFVPNIVVLNYLSRVNRLTDAVKTKSLANIFTGYQRELTYRRLDGSFSAFGNSDKHGSIWLTAFVVKSFIQARPYIDIDQSVIVESMEWLLLQQNKDGSFGELGEVHYKPLQKGAVMNFLQKNFDQETQTGGPLTAYVLIALFHEQEFNPVLNENKDKLKSAEDYILRRLEISNDSYEISLITLALHLADSQHKDSAYQKLLDNASRDSDGLLIHWTAEEHSENEDLLLIPNYLEVECTAYALLSLVHRSDIDNALPALRWLISKQNSNGGFASTQDTVIGLQALGAIAEKIFSSNLEMSVAIKYENTKGSNERLFQFDQNNALVLQQIELEPDTKLVQFEASGVGTAIVQVSYQYNVTDSTLEPAFFLDVHIDQTEHFALLKMCTCLKGDDSTNMTVMQVELPSGYIAEQETLSTSNQLETVKRIETANNDTTVVVYFDRVTQEKICITIPAIRMCKVTNIKPVPVTIYDYCDRNKMTTVFYEL